MNLTPCDRIHSCSSAQLQSTPKLTINAGAACLSAGDTLVVRDGTYVETITATIASGTPGSPTTIKAEHRGGAIIRPSDGVMTTAVNLSSDWLVFDGFVVDMTNITNTGIGAWGKHVTVQYNEVKNMPPPQDPGNGGAGLNTSVTCTNNTFAHNKVHDLATAQPVTNNTHGIYIKCNNVLVEYNEFYNIASHGVQQYNQNTRPDEGSTGSNNIIVRNNIVHDNSSRGILLSSGDNNVAYNNVVYRNGLGDNRGGIIAGFFCTFACTNNKVYNNTVYQNGGAGIALGSTQNAIVQNNICYQNGSDGIYQSGDSNSTIDHNLLGTDPLFVNAAANDFHLGAGSQAIDAGMIMPDLSYNGSAPDLGALESGTSGTLPAPLRLRLVGN